MDDLRTEPEVHSLPSGNSKAFEVYEDTCQKRKHVEAGGSDGGFPDSTERDSKSGTEPIPDEISPNHDDTGWGPTNLRLSLRARTPLRNNTLKVNSTPRSNSQQSIKQALSVERSPGQKYRLQDRDSALPRKSSKLSQFDSPSRDKRFSSLNASPELTEYAGTPPLTTGNIPRSSIFQEGSMNDRTSKCPPPEIIGTNVDEDTEMDIDSKPVEQSYSTFDGGNPSTPRPQAMYNFNSTAKTWNPLKALGKFFSWPSNISSPGKTQEPPLSSKAVAEQVEAQLQGIEDRILGRLAALQAGDVLGQSSINSRSTSELLRSALDSSHDTVSNTPIGVSSVKPFQISAAFSTPNLLLQRAQVGSLTSYSDKQHESPVIVNETSRDPFATLQRLSTKASMVLRNSISPSKSKTARISEDLLRVQSTEVKPIKPQASMPNMLNIEGVIENVSPAAPNDISAMDKVQINNLQAPSSLEIKELPELPGLKNKASQHLKKMASKMNLRNRKPKREDALLVNTHEYRVMKKKNKEEILKEYLALHKEKQELEKQLAHESSVSQLALVSDETAPVVFSPGEQLRREIESTVMQPILLADTTPDFSVEDQASESPPSEGEEQNPMKRNMKQVSKPLVYTSLPLELIHEDKLESKQDQESNAHPELKLWSNPGESTQNVTDPSTNGPSCKETVETSAVRASRAKCRPRVPKPARDGKVHTPTHKGDSWTGWDDDVF